MSFSKNEQQIRRILIVQDEPLLESAVQESLRDAGFEVVAIVNRFRDATSVILNGTAVDLVITDVRLAGVRSGVELARHARELGIAVLFATDQCPEEAVEQDIALACIAKPFKPQDLVRAINVCERLVGSRSPGRLPPGLTVFHHG